MTGWLRMALAAQLGFFALWGAQLLTSHRDAGIVWLATEPVDPRDLLSGHYVALRFQIAAPERARCDVPQHDEASHRVWVRLAALGERVATADGMMPIFDAVACQTAPPSDPRGQVWIAGEFVADAGRSRIVYGIERMYVGEDSPLRTAGSGSVVGKIAINDAFEARLLELITKHAPTEVPPG